MSSTPEEWKERGAVYFDNRNYNAARYSFERAGDTNLINVCQAYILQQTAEELARNPSEQDRSQTKRAFILAAEAFDSLPAKTRKWQRIAAECFGKGGNHLRAAKCFESANIYDKTLMHFWEAKAIDEAARVLCANREQLPSDIVEKYEGRLRNHYVRIGDFE